jgi:hypothetical protein
MKSLYHAYQAYERRVIRGEFLLARKTTPKAPATQIPLIEKLGDLFIQTGMRLKMRGADRKVMTLSLAMGGKQ